MDRRLGVPLLVAAMMGVVAIGAGIYLSRTTTPTTPKDGLPAKTVFRLLGRDQAHKERGHAPFLLFTASSRHYYRERQQYKNHSFTEERIQRIGGGCGGNAER